MKQCAVCERILDLTQFRPTNGRRGGGPRRECTDCDNARLRRAARERKEELIAHYGGRCACCGEDRYEFLAIDHIDGGGGRHRREMGGAAVFYRWLARHLPEGYRVLCHNCNQALGIYGYCPHQQTGAGGRVVGRSDD